MEVKVAVRAQDAQDESQDQYKLLRVSTSILSCKPQVLLLSFLGVPRFCHNGKRACFRCTSANCGDHRSEVL